MDKMDPQGSIIERSMLRESQVQPGEGKNATTLNTIRGRVFRVEGTAMTLPTFDAVFTFASCENRVVTVTLPGFASRKEALRAMFLELLDLPEA